MRRGDEARLTVERPCPQVRLLRVAGRLDRAAGARVLRLFDAQLRAPLTSRCADAPAFVVIDVGEVSSFESGGLESLRHAPYSARRRGIAVYLCGCGGRSHLLPLRTRQLLGEFSTFPTAELAVQTLTDTRPGAAGTAGAVSASRQADTAIADGGPGSNRDRDRDPASTAQRSARRRNGTIAAVTPAS